MRFGEEEGPLLKKGIFLPQRVLLNNRLPRIPGAGNVEGILHDEESRVVNGENKVLQAPQHDVVGYGKDDLAVAAAVRALALEHGRAAIAFGDDRLAQRLARSVTT